MKKDEFSLGSMVKVEKFVEKVGYSNNRADSISIMEKMLEELCIPRDEIIISNNNENGEEFIYWDAFPTARTSDPFYDDSWVKYIEDDKFNLPAREFIKREFNQTAEKSPSSIGGR